MPGICPSRCIVHLICAAIPLQPLRKRFPWIFRPSDLRSGLRTVCTASICSTKLHQAADGRIHLLAGAGVSAKTVPALLEKTPLTQFHMSGKTIKNSEMVYRNPEVFMGIPGMSEYEIWQTDPEAVAAVRTMLDRAADEEA